MKLTRHIFRASTTTLITLFIIESLLRLILAVRVSPDLLLYGTPWQITSLTADWKGGISEEEYFAERHNVATHDNQQEHYSKYQPHEKLKETNKEGLLFDVRINNHGFRGDDYQLTKPPGMLRVACLGDSSTFGYGDRDDETYPEYLEDYLQKRREEIGGGVTQVEVLNFGVPHMLTENMYHILINEVLPAKPDIVTVYSGMFDAAEEVDAFDQEYALQGDVAARLRREHRQLVIERALGKFLVLRLIDSFIPLNKPAGLSRDFWQAFAAGPRARGYLASLEKIRAACARQGVRLYVITQQAQSNRLTDEELHTVSYDDEIRQVLAQLQRSDATRYEVYFLAHQLYDARLRAWAADNGVAVIDGRAALDPYRYNLWHWVHIQPEGNRVLAETVGQRILEDR